MAIGRDTQKDEEWLLQLFIPETNSNKMIIDLLEECNKLLTVDLAQFVPSYSLANTYIQFHCATSSYEYYDHY